MGVGFVFTFNPMFSAIVVADAERRSPAEAAAAHAQTLRQFPHESDITYNGTPVALGAPRARCAASTSGRRASTGDVRRGPRRALMYDGQTTLESRAVHQTPTTSLTPRATNGWSRTSRPGLLALLAAMFIATQAMALSHELEHVSHQHDAPCALHDAAEHLAMASAPMPTTAVALLPASRPVPLPRVVPAQTSARPRGARAPPFLS